MKKILLFKVFFLSLFMAYGQVAKTNTISGTVTGLPAGPGGAHIDRTFSFAAGDFTACTGLTEVEISINLILGNGTPPTPGPYGVHEDLNVRLVSPTGTTVDLIQDRWGYWIGSAQTNTYSGFTAVNGTMNFDDDHPTSVIPVAVNEWTTGNFSPHNPLSTFDGENPVGNWTLRISDGNNQFAGADYFHFVQATLTVTCGTSCTEPDIPVVTATPNPICSGGSTTLNIAGNLNDATQWHIYTGFCGVTPVGTTAGSTFTVSPTTTTTYFVRGQGGCTTPGTCGAITVTVNPAENAGYSYSSSSYCVNAADPTPTITGVGGGSFTSAAGLGLNGATGAIDVSISTPGTYTVTYTTPGACPGTSNQNVTINALDDASFSYSASSYCTSDSDPTPTITGLGGGSFSSTAGLSLNAGTGAIDVSASTPGTYTVTYTTTGSCPNSSNVAVTINAADDASFNYSASSYCVSNSDPTPTITGLPGGSFSSTAGLSLNA
ncbi:MAG: proprotein convertase P-domain-containing protein, partial [Crocinitomicaceae bacterium]|nr:proprotein convertase P-domain-containing protein [Crocinitomicaceae bacterium]